MPELPASQFNVQGGSVYAGRRGMAIARGSPRRSGCRASRSATSWARRTSSRAATACTTTRSTPATGRPNQDGYDVDDHQPAQQRLRSDLRAGRSAERHPAAGRSVPGARHRQPVRARARERARRRHDAGPRLHRGEPQSRALARAAVAPGLAARARQPHGARNRLRRVVCRSAGDHASARTTCPSSIGAAPTSATPSANDFLTANVTNPFYIDRRTSRRCRRPTRCSTQRLPAIGDLHVDDDPAPPSAARVPAHEQL